MNQESERDSSPEETPTTRAYRRIHEEIMADQRDADRHVYCLAFTMAFFAILAMGLLVALTIWAFL